MNRIAAIAALLVFGVGACTANPAVPESASPRQSAPPTPSSTPTPEPPSSTPPAASPSVAPTLAPSLAPETELEALLPDFAGAQYLTKQSMVGEEVLTQAGDPVFQRLLELVEAVPADITAARASGGDVDLFAIAVRGVTGADVAAGMLAALAERDGTNVTEVESGGVSMHRVTLAQDGNETALLLRVAGNALVMGSGTGVAEAEVADVLATLLDPKLEDRLPASVAGHSLTRFSMPAVAVGTTGDMCSMVCPGEPHRLAAALGVPVEDGDLAIAYSQEAELSIVAFRFPGVATAALIPARQALFGEPVVSGTEVSVGGKTVIHHIGDVFSIPGDEEWQYAKDDVLYIVRAKPVDGVPPIVEAAFAALP